jgi:hypothetical protein
VFLSALRREEDAYRLKLGRRVRAQESEGRSEQKATDDDSDPCPEEPGVGRSPRDAQHSQRKRGSDQYDGDRPGPFVDQQSGDHREAQGADSQ